MVRIFPDRIRIRSGLEEFLSVRIRFRVSEYPISVTDPYPNGQKLYFYNVDIHYNLIRQKLTLSVSDSVFKHKYKNKYNISDIHSYPIRFHPYYSQLEYSRAHTAPSWGHTRLAGLHGQACTAREWSECQPVAGRCEDQLAHVLLTAKIGTCRGQPVRPVWSIQSE